MKNLGGDEEGARPGNYSLTLTVSDKNSHCLISGNNTQPKVFAWMDSLPFFRYLLSVFCSIFCSFFTSFSFDPQSENPPPPPRGTCSHHPPGLLLDGRTGHLCEVVAPGGRRYPHNAITAPQLYKSIFLKPGFFSGLSSCMINRRSFLYPITTRLHAHT